MVEEEAVDRKIVRFRSRDEQFYFQRLLEHEARLRPNFDEAWLYYAMNRDNLDPVSGYPYISKVQAERLMNWATFSFTRMLKSMGNPSWELVVDKSREMQGLEPMRRIHERII